MARNIGTNKEVIYAYVRGWSSPNKTGTGNLYFTGSTLYSYGSHFPMAHLLDSGWYVINGDTYSVTTTAHQSLLRRALS